MSDHLKMTGMRVGEGEEEEKREVESKREVRVGSAWNLPTSTMQEPVSI